jgi:hypothetical protein
VMTPGNIKDKLTLKDIEILNLSNMKIFRMQGLENVPLLRQLNLGFNQIKFIESLHECKLLGNKN